jgi:predicted small metal-binding protein
MAGQKERFEVSCSDLRHDCDFTARGKTEEEVLSKCRVHACDAHDKCGDSPKMRDKIRSYIRSVL